MAVRPRHMQKLARRLSPESVLFLWVIPAATIVLPFIALVSSPVVIWKFGVRTQDLVGLLVMYLLVMLGITIGYHRTIAHRSLELIPSARYAIVGLGAMAGQGPPSFWAAHHRAHHADPDGPNDPHSPCANDDSQTSTIAAFLRAHVGWMVGSRSRYDGRFIRDLRRDPVISYVDKHYTTILIGGLLLPAVVLLPLDPHFAAFVQSVYWTGLVRLGVAHQATWLVNSACHLWGYRTFRTPDHSRNNAIVAVLTLGEGWHNNHHAAPARARHGLQKCELDPTYAAILALERIGVALRVRH